MNVIEEIFFGELAPNGNYQTTESYEKAVEIIMENEETLLNSLTGKDKKLENYVANTVRHSALKGYRSYTDNYIKPVLGSKTVSKITATDIQKMYTKLKKSGRIRWHTGTTPPPKASYTPVANAREAMPLNLQIVAPTQK